MVWASAAAVAILALGTVQAAVEPPTCGEQGFIRMLNRTDSSVQQFVDNSDIYEERWDTLVQTRFWRQIMQLGADYTIINNAHTREIYEIICTDDWDALSDRKQDAYRKEIREYNCLESDARIFATTGKQEFYCFPKALHSITKGTEIFCREGVDPWYAQTILLIESPGRSQRSPVGALGSFQLMRSVAIKFGLRVNRYRDDRKDFEKSAVAASQLLSTICIPQVEEMLEKYDICADQDELWFRLLVLHVYHAGAGNVGGVLNKIQPEVGNMELIRTLWRTEHGRFRNASQNYSQVALASLMELNDLIYSDCALFLPEDLPVVATGLF